MAMNPHGQSLAATDTERSLGSTLRGGARVYCRTIRMRPARQRAPTSAEERLSLFAQAPGLRALPPATIRRLAELSMERAYAPGEFVVREGEPGGHAFIVVSGRLEAATSASGSTIPLAVIEAGSLFGEAALFAADGLRQATVTAQTAAILLEIPGDALRSELAANPEVEREVARAVDDLLAVRFLKQAFSPFAQLAPRMTANLAARIGRSSVAAGTEIVREGDPGDSCFFIRTGTVAIWTGIAHSERVIANLGPGAMFGERAVLTGGPRSATARATTDCDLLVLRRADFALAMKASPAIGRWAMDLMQLRVRPRQLLGIVAEWRESPDGSRFAILKDPARGTYYRLTPEGWWIWERLDGEHTLRDLAIGYLDAFRAFAPQAIADEIGRLAEAGMLLDVPRDARNAPGALARARRVLEWRWTYRHVDGWFTRMYGAGVFVLFRRRAQAALAALAIVGLVAFVLTAARSAALIRDDAPWAILTLIPAGLLGVVIHEFGHAFATKAARREVLGVGVGWYWFGPVAFVDTSDLWLATRRQQILASLAGPYADLLVAGLFSLAALAAGGTLAAAICWQVALGSYLSVVLNLNQAEAEQRISDAGLTPSVVYQPVTDPSQDGIVIDQNPSAGAGAKSGEIVIITVGQLQGASPGGDGATTTNSPPP